MNLVRLLACIAFGKCLHCRPQQSRVPDPGAQDSSETPMDTQASLPQRQDGAPGSWLGRLSGRLVASSWAAAPRLLVAMAVITVLLAVFAATQLKMDTQTSRLLDPT